MEGEREGSGERWGGDGFALSCSTAARTICQEERREGKKGGKGKDMRREKGKG